MARYREDETIHVAWPKPAAPRSSEWFVKPFVRVTPKATKAKQVLLSSYSCEDLADENGFGMPETVRKFRKPADAERAAAREPSMCHHIHTASEFGNLEYTLTRKKN